jgi:hypothetical protein
VPDMVNQFKSLTKAGNATSYNLNGTTQMSGGGNVSF